MIGPVILPLDDAVAAVASANNFAPLSEPASQRPILNHVHVFEIVRNAAGILIAGHTSHASHSSHSSHVSSAGSSGGGDDSGDGSSSGYSAPVSSAPVYSVPAAPTSVTATAGDGSADVTWAPVTSDDGGAVTYTITIYPSNISRTVVGATTATITGLQNGMAYSFTVVAANSVGQGPASVASGTVTPLAPQLVGEVPTITGQPIVGQTLRVGTPGWPNGTTFAYQWRADGVSVAGATQPIFIPSLSLAGKRISVSVSGQNPAYAKGATETSAKTPKVAIAVVPTITGRAIVGATLRVHVGKWMAGTKFTYSWFVAGKKVSHDPGPALLVTTNHVGKKITVQVTGVKPGYATVRVSSSPTAPVKNR